jgi:hypothetical protein
MPIDEKPLEIVCEKRKFEAIVSEVPISEDSPNKLPKTKNSILQPRKKIHVFDTMDGKEVQLKRRKSVKCISEDAKDKEMRSYINILKSNNVRISKVNLKNIGFGSYTVAEFKKRNPEEWNLAIQIP